MNSFQDQLSRQINLPSLSGGPALPFADQAEVRTRVAELESEILTMREMRDTLIIRLDYAQREWLTLLDARPPVAFLDSEGKLNLATADNAASEEAKRALEIDKRLAVIDKMFLDYHRLIQSYTRMIDRWRRDVNRLLGVPTSTKRPVTPNTVATVLSATESDTEPETEGLHSIEPKAEEPQTPQLDAVQLHAVELHVDELSGDELSGDQRHGPDPVRVRPEMKMLKTPLPKRAYQWPHHVSDRSLIKRVLANFDAGREMHPFDEEKIKGEFERRKLIYPPIEADLQDANP